jgi:hypothetical protein
MRGDCNLTPLSDKDVVRKMNIRSGDTMHES